MSEKLLLLYPAQNKHLARLKRIAPEWEIVATTDSAVAKKEMATADAVMGNHNLCESLPFNKKLKWIQTNSVGVDYIIQNAGKYLKNKLFTNAKDVYTDEMCEHSLALLFLLQRNLHFLRDAQNKQRWERTENLSLLQSKNVMILGYGSLGKSIGQKLLCFGANVFGINTTTQKFVVKKGKTTAQKYWKDLLPQTDILVLTLPYTVSTRNIIGLSELQMLPKSALVINVGRPETIDETALITLLKTDKIRGAALDVFSNEPLDAANVMWNIKNLFISPHCARSKETKPPFKFERLFEENFKRFINNQPLQNVVDIVKGY